MRYTKKQLNSMRASAVAQAWARERALVMRGMGTRDWTVAQQQELIRTGKVSGFDGQHMKSVADYPQYAGDPRNIQFLTYEEHIWGAHQGNTRTHPTNGYYDPATGVMHEFRGREFRAPKSFPLTDKYDPTQEDYVQLGSAFGYDRGETTKASHQRFKELHPSKRQSKTNEVQNMPANKVGKAEGQTMNNNLNSTSAAAGLMNEDPRLYAELGLSHDQVASIYDPYANDSGSYQYVKSLGSGRYHTPSLREQYNEALSGYKEQYSDRNVNNDSYYAYMEDVKALQESMGYYPDLDARVMEDYQKMVEEGMNPYAAMDELGAFPYLYAVPDENMSEDIDYNPYEQSEDNSNTFKQGEDLNYNPYEQSEDNDITFKQGEDLNYNPYEQSENNDITFKQGEDLDYNPYEQSEDNDITFKQGEDLDYDPYEQSKSNDVSRGESESMNESRGEEEGQSY